MSLVEDPIMIEKLTEMWDGRSQYVILGNTHFEVMTPNGKEEPVFRPTSDGFENNYGRLSTGVTQAPEPKMAVKRSAKAAKKATPKNKVSAEAGADLPAEE